MAFDLTISGAMTTRVRTTIEELVTSYACEMQGTDKLSVGLGHLTDAEVKTVYASLVRTARKHELTLFDPQAGQRISLASAGALPPGWRLDPPLEERAFHASVRRQLGRRFKSLGYLPAQFGFERSTDDHLRQRVSFGQDKGRLMAFVDWQFVFDEKGATGWPAPIALVDYVAATPLEDEWPSPLSPPFWGRLSASPQALSSSLAIIDRVIVDVVHPLFESVATVRELVAHYEDGRLGSIALNIKDNRTPHEAIHVAFGYGKDTLRNMACCYRHLGRIAHGRSRVQHYLDGIGTGEGTLVEELRAEADSYFSDD